MKTIDGETHLNSPLNSPEFIVSHLIPQGIHLLGGSPKIGKSWLVLWMCLQIAKASEEQQKRISKGLFRYAVELELIMKKLADENNFSKERLEEMRKEAINNVRRTRGKVRLGDLFERKDYKSL